MSARALGHVDTTQTNNIMKTLIALLMLTATAAFGQNFNYSTNLFYALTYPTNIYIGSNGTDTGGDSFHVWACKINASQNLFWDDILANQASIASNTVSVASVAATNSALIISLAQLQGGITTNIQFTDDNLLNPSTNTLYFTNGILMKVTKP